MLHQFSIDAISADGVDFRAVLGQKENEYQPNFLASNGS
jgi:hypothetical protein